jgi:beta-phosphoglucomutase-like phosphatase (HAD superfamily)
MILAVIFDLDGTLVETEELKTISYARAAVELRPEELSVAEVIDAFKEVVGLSRREVAIALIERFALETAAQQRMAEFGVDTPWQAYVQIQLRIYEDMLNDSTLLWRYRYPHTLALLNEVQQGGCLTALATMSYCAQVRRVLEILGMSHAFHFIASRDDVEHGKPDPEIYLLVAHELGIPPEDCLVIEDSPAGVKAGLAAGMNVVAIGTKFTRQRLHESSLLPAGHIADDPVMLPQVVAHVIAHHRHEAQMSSLD